MTLQDALVAYRTYARAEGKSPKTLLPGLSPVWARLAVNVGDKEATRILDKEWGASLPDKVIETGLLQKARFVHLS